MQYLENDKLDHLIGLALLDCGNKDAEMFRNIDTSDIPDNPRLDRKISRLIKRKEREAAVKKTKRIAWRVAIAAMLILSIMFATLMSITAIREAIWKAIVSWYENYITVQYEPSQAEETEYTNYNSLIPESTEADSNTNADIGINTENNINAVNNNESIVILPPTEILEVRKPTWLPEGTIEDLVSEDKWTVYRDYYLNDEYIASFQQLVLKKYERYYNNENALIENFYIGKSEAIFVSYKDYSEKYIVWSDGEYIYTLTSEILEKEQMMQIAESVK